MEAAGAIDPSEYTPTIQTIGLDFVLLLSYPALLIVVPYIVGPKVYNNLIFWAQEPTILSAFGHSIIHLSTSHLWTNVSTYTVLALSAYGLAIWSIEFQWFRKAFLLNILLTPVVSTMGISVFLKDFPGITPVPTAGSSGVIAGLAGISFILFLGLTQKETDRRYTLVTAFSLLFIFGGEMGVLLHGSFILGGAVICVGIGGFVAETLSRYMIGEKTIQTGLLSPVQFTGYLLFVITLLTTILWSMFHFRPPAQAVNTLGHAAGLLSGIAIALLTGRFHSGKWLSRYFG